MVDRIQEELGQEATIVATGGLAKRIIPLCRHHIELDDELLLRGFGLFTRRINKVCDSDMKKAVGESLTTFYCIG